MNSLESGDALGELEAVVYVSDTDGSDMHEVASVRLDYDRGAVGVPVLPEFCPPGWCSNASVTLRWRPWESRYRTLREDTLYAVYPMPVLADIVFDGAGNLVLGLKDRQADVTSPLGYRASPPEWDGMGVGDILRGVRDGAAWRIETDPEHYDDAQPESNEIALGALAVIPGADRVATTSLLEMVYPAPGNRRQGAVWFDDATGQRLAREAVCSGNAVAVRPSGSPDVGCVPARIDRPADALTASSSVSGRPDRFYGPAHNEGVDPGAVGDIEALCPSSRVVTPTAPASVTPTPSPTPSLTPSPASSPRPSPTAPPTPCATPSRVPTATATPTPTPSARPLYLPLLLRERCPVEKQRVDVALVIDASTSMRDGFTAAGRTRLAAALEAARTFVAGLALPADQAAVVCFNNAAWVEVGLTGRRADVQAALARIPDGVRQQTRIDLGIEAAQLELSGPRHRAINRPVMIVLTDGLANPEPASTAVQRAAAAKADEITIFTIGLGDERELNVPELTQMASRAEYFYHAPDAEDLAAIYRAIAVELPCPGVRLWVRR